MKTLEKQITAINPHRYIWDFWYYYDQDTKIFHLFYLNADYSKIAGEKFHNSAEVGYASTKDFIDIKWGPYNVLTADERKWYNTSIWSGDIIKINNGYLLFFTSRDNNEDDGFTQNIGAAFSETIDTDKWEVVPNIRIKPDFKYYEINTLYGDASIHAWRDPYLFIHDDQIHMLVSAKSKNAPLGKNGAIALLRSTDGSFINWKILPPISNPSIFPEMEVSQLMKDGKGNYELLFSCSFKHNEDVIKNKIGGLYSINSPNLKNLNLNKSCELLPLSSNLYACRVIPELEGEIIGFDTETGGIRRSGIKTNFKNLNRDFSEFKL